VPRKGNVFVYFDVSQAEMRIAAYLSADPAFMAACGDDVHAGNARNVFPQIADKGWLEGEAKKDPLRGKKYRDIAKNLGFAIAYGAEEDKVFLTLQSKGFEVSLRAVRVILARLRSAYHVYYRFVEENLSKVRQVGFMRTPVVGRIRWLGWYPKPTDVSNFPVQSCLADVMNLRTIALSKRLPRGCDLVAQVHDACTYDVPHTKAALVERLIREAWAEPIPLKGGPLVLPIDLKRGDRWSDL
jgi:DNA polymerase I-like protein with 3'-5' exonuclease and polymerase domains